VLVIDCRYSILVCELVRKVVKKREMSRNGEKVMKGHALIQSQKNFVSCKPLCGKREKMSRNGEMVMKGHVLIKS